MRDTRKIGTIEDRSADPDSWVRTLAPIHLAELPESTGTVNVSVFVHGQIKVEHRPAPGPYGFVSLKVGESVSILLNSPEEASALFLAARSAVLAFAAVSYVEDIDR